MNKALFLLLSVALIASGVSYFLVDGWNQTGLNSSDRGDPCVGIISRAIPRTYIEECYIVNQCSEPRILKYIEKSGLYETEQSTGCLLSFQKEASNICYFGTSTSSTPCNISS